MPRYLIAGFDKFNYAASEFNLHKLMDKPNFSVVKGDICNSHELDKIWQKPFDYIIHFAAESHVDRSIDTSNIFFENNVLLTLQCFLTIRHIIYL